MAYVTISIPDHLLTRINELRVRYAHNMEPQHICLMRIVRFYEEHSSDAHIPGRTGLASQREEAERERAERTPDRRDPKRAGRSDPVATVVRKTRGRLD